MIRTLSSFAFMAVLAGAPAVALAQPANPLLLTADDAVSRAFAASHRLAELTARARGAEAARAGAAAADNPTTRVSAGYTRTNHVPEFAVAQPSGGKLVVFPDIPDNYFTRVAFEWPIYTSGRAGALERAALAETAAVGADLDTARADLRFEVVRAYWAVATSREAVRVLEETVTRAVAQLTDARARFDVGLIPPHEVSSLDAQLSRERAQLIEARNAEASALIDLRRLIGASLDTPITIADALDAGLPPGTASPASPQAAIDEALGRRPERQALAHRADGATARQEAALAALKPTMGVGGSADWANPNARIFPRQNAWLNSWDLGVSVSWPVFDGGRAKAQAAEAAAAADATRERLADLDATVAADVSQRLLDVDSSLAMVQAATAAVVSAEDARRVVADRFAAGVATSTDVLVAQDALLTAQLGRTRALANVKLAEARLRRAMGPR